ncbi:MAG: serine/threonine protein kinase [Gammaproteobacteria bacterium]|nr:serine/threonine protein kinase [Gammaproteobacteria bacterium]
MPRFAKAPEDDYPIVYLADTDKPLPRQVNPHTRYAYFKLIARGGRSIVQACKDLHLMRVVCYKSLKAEFAEDPDEQRRFVREARVSAMLQHPNTVPTYELGRDLQGHYYFTMKMVHGYTLREVLDYRERYDLTRLVDVVIQVAHALEYAHGHGVAHRDIKPENILVGPFGEVLVLDWGLAKVWHPEGTSGDDAKAEKQTKTAVVEDLSLTLHGRLQGTVSYMSPEQIRMDPDLDFRTDIYSLGAVLYEALAGVPPVSGTTINEILDKTLHADLVVPSEHASTPVPERLEEICMRCLRPEPGDRVQTSGELIRELQEDW